MVSIVDILIHLDISNPRSFLMQHHFETKNNQRAKQQSIGKIFSWNVKKFFEIEK